MPIDSQKKILALGSTLRFHSHRVANFVPDEVNMFANFYGRSADKLLYGRVDQISAEFAAAGTTELAIQSGIAIHPEPRNRYGNRPADGLKLVDDASSCFDEELGHDRSIMASQVDALRRDFELGRPRRIAELAHGTHLELVGIEISTEQRAFVEHGSRELSADEYQAVQVCLRHFREPSLLCQQRRSDLARNLSCMSRTHDVVAIPG